MIFYFTGTGNSKWIAEQIAETIEYGEKSQGKYRYTFEKYYRKVRTGLHK